MYLKLAENSKKPVRGPWQLSEQLLNGNVGLTLEDRTVVDFDAKGPAREFYRKHKELCTVIVETRRGVHYHFYGETQGRKFEHGDIKSGRNQYVVVPPSMIDGFQYRYVEIGQIQKFPEELFPIKVAEKLAVKSIGEVDILRRITRARAWLAKAEPAVSGQRRQYKMFFCCCRMFQMFELSLEQAWPLILEYNDRCQPPLSEKDLRRKIEDAMARCTP